MVKKVESFTTYDGNVFLSEEAAVRHESLQRLCEIIPEFQMVRPRIEEQLDAVASAMGPMVAFRARVPSEGPIVDPSALQPGEEVDRIYLDGKVCNPATGEPCPYKHPKFTTCPNCQDWKFNRPENPVAGLTLAHG